MKSQYLLRLYYFQITKFILDTGYLCNCERLSYKVLIEKILYVKSYQLLVTYYFIIICNLLLFANVTDYIPHTDYTIHTYSNQIVKNANLKPMTSSHMT